MGWEWDNIMNQTTLSALAEPNRFQMVEILKKGPLTVGELAERMQIRQPQASKHLRILSEAGIVSVEVDANRRIYRLKPEPFMQLEGWLSSYIELWEDRFNQLDGLLFELQRNKEKS